MTVKECVGPGRFVRFDRYCDNNLWYVCDNGFNFPVPIDDAREAVFNATEPSMLFMRWIRRHLDWLKKCRNE